jgi:hypothetical protein
VAFDFSLSPRAAEWRDRIRTFVDDVVAPRALIDAVPSEAGRTFSSWLVLAQTAPTVKAWPNT